MSELIHDGFSIGGVTGAIFLDVQKAFDKVVHKALIFKLFNNGVDPQLVKIFNDYLSFRTFLLRVGNSHSIPHPVFSSVPQGSLCGPKLYNFYTNDIPRLPNVSLALFADDTAIMYRHSQPHIVFQKLQKYFDTYLDWLKKWRIKVNSAKSAAIFFTRKNYTPNANLLLNNQAILWETSYKYLGLHLDSKLQWHKHITEKLSKAKRATGSVNSLLAWNSHLLVKNKLLLYKSLIRPVITYGLAVYRSEGKTQLRRIQIFQNRELHRYVKAFLFVCNSVIHKGLKIQPIFVEIKKFALKFYRSILTVRNSVLNSNRRYDARIGWARQRPRNILYRDIDFVPVSQKRR